MPDLFRWFKWNQCTVMFSSLTRMYVYSRLPKCNLGENRDRWINRDRRALSRWKISIDFLACLLFISICPKAMLFFTLDVFRFHPLFYNGMCVVCIHHRIRLYNGMCVVFWPAFHSLFVVIRREQKRNRDMKILRDTTYKKLLKISLLTCSWLRASKWHKYLDRRWSTTWSTSRSLWMKTGSQDNDVYRQTWALISIITIKLFLGIDWFDSWAFGMDYQTLW